MFTISAAEAALAAAAFAEDVELFSLTKAAAADVAALDALVEAALAEELAAEAELEAFVALVDAELAEADAALALVDAALALVAEFVAFVFTSPATVFACPDQVLVAVITAGSDVPYKVSARVSKFAGSVVRGGEPKLGIVCVMVVIRLAPAQNSKLRFQDIAN